VPKLVSILEFAYRIGFTNLYDWQWLESEVGTPSGGFLYGRASDVASFVEGIHDQHGSPAGLLIDEARSIRDEILDTLERCLPKKTPVSRVILAP
jgi:hypothetical protein